jgi:hypothetical protein
MQPVYPCRIIQGYADAGDVARSATNATETAAAQRITCAAVIGSFSFGDWAEARVGVDR